MSRPKDRQPLEQPLRPLPQPGPDPAAVALDAELDRLYAGVPATRCAGCGSCCQLTDDEYRRHFATMFPLYRAEYARIARHVRTAMPTPDATRLLALTEERPRRCPFLDTDNACTIYAVRPLICRTYAVMDREAIAAAVRAHQGAVPDEWLRRFAAREEGMACARVRVAEPAKLAAHAHALVTFAYERVLLELGLRVELVDGPRRQVYEAATGLEALPACWSWGGYNALCASPMSWLRASFARYWARARLPNAG